MRGADAADRIRTSFVHGLDRLPGRPSASVVAAVALVLAAYLLLVGRDEHRLADARALLDSGHAAQAIEKAREVGTRPASTGALAVEARAYAAAGNPAAALRMFRSAVMRAPHDWELRRDWAAVLLATGQRAAAQTQMIRAAALNPQIALPPGFTRFLRNTPHGR